MRRLLIELIQCTVLAACFFGPIFIYLLVVIKP